ncbi:MAG: glycosyltransferase [Gemmataceae bacterium]
MSGPPDAPAVAGPDPPPGLGVVVIGRNEGDRLRRCLDAVPAGVPVVYVDSGSTDDSVGMSRRRGVAVVELDLATPFTAARARNAGAGRLVERHPAVRVIQFVDGDCELVPGWLAAGGRALADDGRAGIVCGRTRERHPERSIYNRLCDIEWDVPAGEVAACGGIMMVRADVFAAVGGFDPAVIAAEDDEFCLRVRRTGRTVVRVGHDMVLHDAAMTRASQWWTRSVRCGYAYALGAGLHGRGPERHFVRERRRAVIWGGVVPLLAVVPAVPTGGWSLALFGLYAVQLARVYHGLRRRVAVRRHALAYAAACVLGKFPQAVGVWRYARDRRRRRAAQIIEYK